MYFCPKCIDSGQSIVPSVAAVDSSTPTQMRIDTAADLHEFLGLVRPINRPLHKLANKVIIIVRAIAQVT